MTENDNTFKTNERFPKEMAAPERLDILNELLKFNIHGADTIKLVDSTHDDNDIRLNYIIDKKWVLRFCNLGNMTEKRIGDISRLIERYRAEGFKCPEFIKDDSGKYLHHWNGLICYLSEYIDMPLANEVKLSDEEQLYLEVVEREISLAEKYRDVDLSETMGMYSLFDLSPFDKACGVDEKQQNFDLLLSFLHGENEDELAKRLEKRHTEIRRKLKSVYRKLPRCVFQGDENFSNVLIDEEQRFVGFIDFNLAGTEVIVNQLANLIGFDYDEDKMTPVGAEARLDYAVSCFQERINRMLRLYHADETERQALAWYAWIVMVAQYPTFCFFKQAIKDAALKSEALELLYLIADIPEKRLVPNTMGS